MAHARYAKCLHRPIVIINQQYTKGEIHFIKYHIEKLIKGDKNYENVCVHFLYRISLKRVLPIGKTKTPEHTCPLCHNCCDINTL